MKQYSLTVDNLSLHVPLDQSGMLKCPSELIGAMIEPYTLCTDQDIIKSVSKRGHITLVYKLDASSKSSIAARGVKISHSVSPSKTDEERELEVAQAAH